MFSIFTKTKLSRPLAFQIQKSSLELLLQDLWFHECFVLLTFYRTFAVEQNLSLSLDRFSYPSCIFSIDRLVGSTLRSRYFVEASWGANHFTFALILYTLSAFLAWLGDTIYLVLSFQTFAQAYLVLHEVCNCWMGFNCPQILHFVAIIRLYRPFSSENVASNLPSPCSICPTFMFVSLQRLHHRFSTLHWLGWCVSFGLLCVDLQCNFV